jgi:hypothetical protein
VNSSTIEAVSLIRNAIAVLDHHTERPHFAGPWTTDGGDLYGTDPASGRTDYPVAIGGDEIGSGLSPDEANFIARTAGNPRFLRAVRLILTDAEQQLDRNRATLGDVADALRLAESLIAPGALGQPTMADA